MTFSFPGDGSAHSRAAFPGHLTDTRQGENVTDRRARRAGLLVALPARVGACHGCLLRGALYPVMVRCPPRWVFGWQVRHLNA